VLLKPPRGRRVVVHTRRPDDQTVAGVLVRQDRRWLVLDDCEYLASASSKHELENRVWIPLASVSWIEEVS
jgi:hypothetical protein